MTTAIIAIALYLLGALMLLSFLLEDRSNSSRPHLCVIVAMFWPFLVIILTAVVFWKEKK